MFPSIMTYMRFVKVNAIGLHVALKLVLSLTYILFSSARALASRMYVLHIARLRDHSLRVIIARSHHYWKRLVLLVMDIRDM
jgi:hypothetical protein